MRIGWIRGAVLALATGAFALVNSWNYAGTVFSPFTRVSIGLPFRYYVEYFPLQPDGTFDESTILVHGSAWVVALNLASFLGTIWIVNWLAREVELIARGKP